MDKYEEALQRARELYETGNFLTRQQVGIIFPELRESEDERIRKELVDFVNHYRHNTDLTSEQAEWCKKALAYLEKQKEQKPKNILTDDDSLQTAYLKGQTDVLEDPEAYGLQKEQKPAEWSEEDKRKLNRIYEILGYAADDRAFFTSKRIIGDKEAIELQDFLKSLCLQPKQNVNDMITPDKEFFQWIYNRLVYVHEENPNVDYMRSFKKRIDHSVFGQYHWKPSEEQVSMLLAVINDPNNAGSESCHLALISIYEQLKKL